MVGLVWGQTQPNWSWAARKGQLPKKRALQGFFWELGKGKLDFLVSFRSVASQGAGMTEVRRIHGGEGGCWVG